MFFWTARTFSFLHPFRRPTKGFGCMQFNFLAIFFEEVFCLYRFGVVIPLKTLDLVIQKNLLHFLGFNTLGANFCLEGVSQFGNESNGTLI